MSRGRSLLIDAGGLLGALAGASIPAFANSENGPAIGASGLAGMATGLAIAAYVTRDWDEDRDEPRAARGGGAMAVPMLARLEGGGFSAGVGGAVLGHRVGVRASVTPSPGSGHGLHRREGVGARRVQAGRMAESARAARRRGVEDDVVGMRGIVREEARRPRHRRSAFRCCQDDRD